MLFAPVHRKEKREWNALREREREREIECAVQCSVFYVGCIVCKVELTTNEK